MPPLTIFLFAKRRSPRVSLSKTTVSSSPCRLHQYRRLIQESHPHPIGEQTELSKTLKGKDGLILVYLTIFLCIQIGQYFPPVFHFPICYKSKMLSLFQNGEAASLRLWANVLPRGTLGPHGQVFLPNKILPPLPPLPVLVKPFPSIAHSHGRAKHPCYGLKPDTFQTK